jgi:hypothetical protein
MKIKHKQEKNNYILVDRTIAIALGIIAIALFLGYTFTHSIFCDDFFSCIGFSSLSAFLLLGYPALITTIILILFILAKSGKKKSNNK